MKHVYYFLLLSFMTVSCTYTGKPDSFRKNVPVDFSEVKINDNFWSPRLKKHAGLTLKACIYQCEHETQRIRNFAIAAGMEKGEFKGFVYDDSDVYKMIEGASYSLMNNPNPQLEQKMDSIIEKIAKAQLPDGYLMTYFELKNLNERWTDMDKHEMYCCGHLIEAGIAYFKATGKRSLLDVAIKYANHIDDTFGEGKREWVPGHQEIELALIKLYRTTGEDRYLKLAHWLLEQRGHGKADWKAKDYYQDLKPVKELTGISGHAVRAMYMFTGMADYSAVTKDTTYIRALNCLWDDVAGTKMYLTGGIGSSHHNEGFSEDFDLPNEEAYCETCASVGMVFWNQRMNMLKGEGKYADVLERAMYNGALAGISLEGDSFFYVNPLASQGNHHRQAWYGTACCPSQISRFLPSVGSYIYALSSDALWINLFIGSETKVNFGGTEVKITQKTDYPWDGLVTIAISPAGSIAFETKLRLPGWCENYTLKVNGKEVVAKKENGYLSINRKWKEGDVIEFTMDMPVEVVRSDPRVKSNIGKRAIQRGPLVYCVEECANPDFNNIFLTPATKFQTMFKKDILGGAVVIEATDGDRTYEFNPYYSWDNREPGKMEVWVDYKESAKRYVELPLGAIKPKGWLNDMLVRQRNGMTSQMDELYPEVMGARNGWLGGDGDQWERGPYWLDGLIPLAYILDDKALKDKAQAWIEWTLNSQREDGFFGPSKNYDFEKGLQRNNSEDWWPRMVVMKFMKQYYMATADNRVIDFLTRYFRYQLKTLPDKSLGYWTSWAEYRMGDNLQMVYWLYDITGDSFLLNLGELLHRQGFDFTGAFLKGDMLSRMSSIHGVNLAQGIKEPVIYYQHHPEAKYVDAVRKAFEDIRHFHGQPQGMYGGDESVHGTNPTQGAELCSVAELMYSLEEMGRITGDVDFLDHLERIAFNALPTQISDDFMSRQYFQQPNQIMITRAIRNFDINHEETDLLYGFLTGYPCCTSNLHQAWPKFAQNLWYGAPDGGIAALSYSPSTVEAVVAGNVKIRIEEDTYYPMDDKVYFTVNIGSGDVIFPFHLRIPGWCTSSGIFINDKLYGEFRGGTIAVVNRRWKNGDRLLLELPMKIVTETWHENAVSVYRGPLLYALRIEEEWRECTLEKGSIFGKSFFEILPLSKWNYGLMDFDHKNPEKYFEVNIDREKIKNDNPWTLRNVPIEIKAKAKEIPSWKTYNNMAGPVPYSKMIYGLQTEDIPEQAITLLPYGCTTLRISEFPVIVEKRR